MWVNRSRRPVSPIGDPRYRTAPYVLAGRWHDETFLLNKKTGKYYRLDDVGSELWAMLQRPRAVPEILQELSVIYDKSPHELAEDVSHLLATLLGYDVIACGA